MRPEGRAFVQKIATRFNVPEPIYEFGSFQVPGQEELANLRPFFPGKTYIGCDMTAGPGVDSVMNMENTQLASCSVGTVISIDTLEHVKNVHAAVLEIYRILKPGGLCIIASVMLFPIHRHPDDYWRFTPSAFALLLENFTQKEITSDGDPHFPVGIYGFGVK